MATELNEIFSVQHLHHVGQVSWCCRDHLHYQGSDYGSGVGPWNAVWFVSHDSTVGVKIFYWVGVFVSLEMFISFQGIAVATTRFRFDGQPISATDTPISLEMEEGDTIEVYQQQTGGRGPYICWNESSFMVLLCWGRGLCCYFHHWDWKFICKFKWMPLWWRQKQECVWAAETVLGDNFL